MKHSLWFQPPKEHYEKYKKIIQDLSKKRNSPLFEPHITLLGDIEREDVVLRTEQLSKLLRPFTVKLTKSDYMNEYFKCVFVLLEKTHELMMANDISKRIFYRESDPDYMPHLSLLYGDFSKEVKEEINSELPDFNEEFLIDRVHVVKSEDINDWEIVASFDLRA